MNYKQLKARKLRLKDIFNICGLTFSDHNIFLMQYKFKKKVEYDFGLFILVFKMGWIS